MRPERDSRAMPGQRHNPKVGPAGKTLRKKVVGMSGSPRRGGYSDLLLDSALAGAASEGCLTEKIFLNDIRFKPCQDCGGCRANGICILDDGLRPVYRKLETADVVIVSSPVFFGSVSAQLKMMVDRAQCLWVRKYILGGIKVASGRKGIFLCTAGRDDTRPFRNASEIIGIFFKILDIEYAGRFFLEGVNSLSAASPRFKAALKRVFKMGAMIGRGRG